MGVGKAEFFPFYILHWQYEAKMGENSPVDTQKPGKVAGSSGNGELLCDSQHLWDACNSMQRKDIELIR